MPQEPDKNDTPEQEPTPDPAGEAAPRRRARRAKPARDDSGATTGGSAPEPAAEGEDAAESPAAELEAAEAAPMAPVIPDDEPEEEPELIEVHETVTVTSLPLSAMDLLQAGVEAMSARQRRGAMAPMLQRQVRKAAAVAGGVVQAAEVAPGILDEYGPALVRLAVLMGTDPGRKKSHHRALAAFIRQERKILESALS